MADGGSRHAAQTDAVDVVAIGETMVMLVPEQAVPLAEATGLAVHVGGAESNVAAYLAQLGYRVRWGSRLGDDPFGELILRHLGQAGVDTSAVVRVPGGRTGLYVKDPGGVSTSVHYYRAQAPARDLAPDALRDPRLAGGRVLHLSGITAALSDSALALVRAAVDGPREPGRLVSFDVNFRRPLWSAEVAGPVLRELANASDLVFVGFDEAQSLWDCPTPADVRALLPGPRTVVIKDGAVGAYAFGADGEVFVPTPKVTVVEPVGAGDAFAAGYLAAALDGEPDRARLRLGHLVAAAALGVRGDHARLPERSRLRELVALTDDDWGQLDLTGGH
jgi:2-dehydro-3-deoxygluconokinase